MTPNKNNKGAAPALADTATLQGRLAVCVEKAGGKRALAAKAIISEAQLFRYLGGINDMPLEKVLGIAKAAGVDPGWLATGVDSKPTTKQRPEFRPALMQFTARMLDEFLLEYQRTIPPRLKSQLLTLIYEALRHEEVVRGTEALPNKFQMLEYLTFFEPFKTEELLQTYHEVMTQMEYGNVNVNHKSLLNSFCSMVTEGWENYYNNYVGQVYFDRVGEDLAPGEMERVNATVADVLEKLGKSDLKWLDLACGNGRSLKYLHDKYPKFELAGIDISSRAVDFCHALETRGKLPKGCVVKGDCRQLPYEDQSFDVINASYIMFFMPYFAGSGLGVEAAWQEISRILMPKGIIILTTFTDPRTLYTNFRQFMSVSQLDEIAGQFGFEKLAMSEIESAVRQPNSVSQNCIQPEYKNNTVRIVYRKR